MGRRSINTTKSGKFMNPTDQARKEARKRELKKNRRQRMTVRHAVLKSKDPVKILEEIKLIDQAEFDPLTPPSLNEKVLKEKRKKLKETFQRVLKLYEKEDPEFSVELRKTDLEQDRRRDKLQVYYEQVKNTERVQVDQIPLPEIIYLPSETGLIPLPDDIPRGILKHRSIYLGADHERGVVFEDIELPERRTAPPGPPPGTPLLLSDSEDEDYDPEKGIEENLGKVDLEVLQLPDEESIQKSSADLLDRGKHKKIRFAEDAKDTAPEKDTRLTIKKRSGTGVSPLQIRMLQLAGQAKPAEMLPPGVERPGTEVTDDAMVLASSLDAESIPMPPLPEEPMDKDDDRDSSSDEDSPDDDDDDASDASDKSDDDSDADDTDARKRQRKPADSSDEDDELIPPGPPPGMPPNLMPPLAPPPMPMMNLLPRVPQLGPLRPIGLPPGPPPGLPMSLRGVMPRMPGMHGGLPPRIPRPPTMPMGIPPPSIPLPPGLGPQPIHPAILSAPPSIMKPTQAVVDERRATATIEAKPQIKTMVGDVTKFMPTALKIKRQIRDSKGRIRHIGKEEEKIGPAPKQASKAAPQTKTKDHAYEAFMKEMSTLM